MTDQLTNQLTNQLTYQQFSSQQEDLLQANNQQAVHMQAELPTLGTALNPVESEWAMNQQASAMPADLTANAMDQGE